MYSHFSRNYICLSQIGHCENTKSNSSWLERLCTQMMKWTIVQWSCFSLNQSRLESTDWVCISKVSQPNQDPRQYGTPCSQDQSQPNQGSQTDETPCISIASYTGWHIRLWRTSRWHQNWSSVLAWLGQDRPGQNGTTVLKSTGGSSQPHASPCTFSQSRLASVPRVKTSSPLCFCCRLSFSSLNLARRFLASSSSALDYVISVARWQNLIPSFTWTAPGWRAERSAVQGEEGIKFCSVT